MSKFSQRLDRFDIRYFFAALPAYSALNRCAPQN
jgi:hypothetical protein